MVALCKLDISLLNIPHCGLVFAEDYMEIDDIDIYDCLTADAGF